MALLDKHIDYLKQVEENQIRLWWNPTRTVSKYVHRVHGTEVDQIVAAQMHTLGATHVVAGGGIKTRVIALTERGKKILLDEAEAWA